MFKKVLSAFVEITPEEGAAPAEVQSKSAPVSPNTTSTPPTTPVVTSTPPPLPAAAGINEEMKSDLLKAITHANLEGYDYLELMDAVKNMSNLPFTDEQKIMAAFATVANLTTREKLMASVDHYMQVIDESEKKFMATAEKKMQLQVVGKENEIQNLEQELNSLSLQITQITTRVQEIQIRKQSLSSEKEAQRAKIESTKQTFATTAQSVREQLRNDKTRLGSALGINQK